MPVEQMAVIPASNHTLSLSNRLQEAVQRLGADNEQLKRENERLARVIDSGDWGRQRVQELVEAGRVLQAERDALQKLVGAAGAAQGPMGSSGCGSAGMIAAGLPPPLSDATNSPEPVPTVSHSPGLAGSGDFGSGVLQRYRVSAAGIQPSGGTAIAAGWGGSSAGGGRQAISTSRPASPAARNKLLVSERSRRVLKAGCAQCMAAPRFANDSRRMLPAICV